jgi:hypothetical protein
MIKKIVLGVLATGLVALLVVGAVNRTSTQAGGILDLGTAQAQANGPQGNRGAGGGGARGEVAPVAGQSDVRPGGQVAEQRGGGYGRGRQTNEAPAVGQNAVPGGQVAEQRGGGYGRGRQTNEAPAVGQNAVPGGQVAEQRGGGNGRGRQVNESPAAGQNSAVPNVGQTGVSEWAEVSGVVVSADETALVVQAADGATVEIVNRPWSFAVSQGFMAAAGDQVTLTGFYEGDTFEAAQISDATSGQNVSIRDDAGRPLWAGGGRRS